VQVIGDYLQVFPLQQGLGDGFGGGADIDEHGGVVRDHLDHGGCDALFRLQVHDLSSLVRGISGAGVDTGTAVMTAQLVLFGKLIQVPADSLGCHLELINELLGGDEPVLLDQLHDQILPAPLCHSNYLRVISCSDAK